MLLPVAVTAVVLGLAAPLSLAFAWRVPFGLLPTRTVLRSAMVTSLGTFLIGAIVEGCAAAGGPTRGVLGAVVGGTFMATLTWLRARRGRHARGTLLLAMRLTDPTTRDRARETIDENLERLAKKGWNLYAETALVVVGAASQVALFDYARTLLERIPEDSLSPHSRALVAQALSTCRVRLGDLEGARQALDGLDRPAADPSVEAWIRTLEALLDALGDTPEQALSATEAPSEDADPSFAASCHLVRAHALAALGREEEARAELQGLLERLGEGGLDQALTPEGPASGLARTMAGEAD